MSDILYASGAIHDEIGPITSFAPMSEAGHAWLHDWAGIDDRGSYCIETSEQELVISCMERDGLKVASAA